MSSVMETGVLREAARPPREMPLRWRHVFTLARKEVRDSLRSRWFLLYSLAFAVLGLTHIFSIFLFWQWK